MNKFLILILFIAVILGYTFLFDTTQEYKNIAQTKLTPASQEINTKEPKIKQSEVVDIAKRALDIEVPTVGTTPTKHTFNETLTVDEKADTTDISPEKQEMLTSDRAYKQSLAQPKESYTPQAIELKINGEKLGDVTIDDIDTMDISPEKKEMFKNDIVYNQSLAQPKESYTPQAIELKINGEKLGDVTIDDIDTMDISPEKKEMLQSDLIYNQSLQAGVSSEEEPIE